MTLSPFPIEQATLLAWPALEEITDRSWSARFARGYTKRANSIHCLDLADDGDAGGRINALAGQYGRRGLRPTFRLTPLAGPAIGAALDEQRWDIHEPSLVLSMPLGKRQYQVPSPTRYFEAADPEWRQVQGALAGYSLETAILLGSILDQIKVPACGVVVYDKALQPAGAALAVTVGEIAVFLNVVVDRSRRGQGFGRAVMHAALNWTGQMGAGLGAIQVLADNGVALSLYRSLGFADSYGYHYRRAPL